MFELAFFLFGITLCFSECVEGVDMLLLMLFLEDPSPLCCINR